LYQDEDFIELYASTGRPGESPWRLALITIMQFIENLSDRQAAEAVRSRIDWKYALSLPLEDSGFDFSVLSEFRGRLLQDGASEKLLTKLLEKCQRQGLVKARGKQRTDSTHVLGAIRDMNRCECVGETLRHALNELAVVAPDWVRVMVSEDWYERYGVRIESSKLPKGKTREQWMQQVGMDGHHLLAQIYEGEEVMSQPLKELTSVETLRQVWIQQFYLDGKHVRIRAKNEIPPSKQLIESPYDVEARNRTKRTTYWVGYCVNLTETCDPERPNLITHVETVPATSMDVEVTELIHKKLAEKHLLPEVHYVDTGYVSADVMLHLKENYDVEVVGPVLPDTSWQAKEGKGFDLSNFTINWPQKQVQCPQGHETNSWSEQINRHGQQVIHVHFPRKYCETCLARSDCTKSKTAHGRSLNFRAEKQHTVLQTAREYQTTNEFQERYGTRAGVEGTISQGVRAFGLRRSRYIGLGKTHLQHVMTAVAMNIARLWNWWQGIPKAQTRVSHFASLAAAI
jgi:transposase